MSAIDTMQAALYGNPPLPLYQPDRAGVLNAFTELVQSTTAASLGILVIDTVADLPTSPVPTNGQLARVFNDPTSANNTIYEYKNGSWAVAADFLNTLSILVQTFTGDKNLFDLTTVMTGFEVQYTGIVAAESNSALSQPIYVGNLQSISISGLPSNPALDRVYAFFNATPTGTSTFISSGTISGNQALNISVPDGAQWLRVSVQQRDAGSPSFSTVQIEGGITSTIYQPYTKRIATLYGERMGDRPQPSIVTQIAYIGDKNLFDMSTALSGMEVQFSGLIAAEANSVLSDAIYVGDLRSVSISGLQENPSLARVYAFYSDFPNTTANFVGYGQITGDFTSGIPIPHNAKWMRFCPKQRNPGTTPNLATAQVEAGFIITPYSAFSKRIRTINNQKFNTSTSLSSGIVALFGDSITETENVDSGQYIYGSNTRQNWPDFVLPTLNYVQAYSYAKAGAAFANYSGSTTTQRFQTQIDNAIAGGYVADTIVVALGINDYRFLPGTLGDYTTAMGKTIANLDETVGIESARKGFYRLQAAFPNAVKFVSTPIQNNQGDMVALKTWNDLIARMAGRYGFQVIDAFDEAGIVADFESTGSSPGQDLSDGLHPNRGGQAKMGRLIGAKIRNRLFG